MSEIQSLGVGVRAFLLRTIKKNAIPFQSYGSQLTYFRRYGISQILGLVTDKDTDAAGETTKKKMFPKERFDTGVSMVFKNEITKEQFIKAMKGYELTQEQSNIIAEL